MIVIRCAESDEIDKTVMQLLAALGAQGLAKNTFVFYTADPGGQGHNANAPLSGGKGAVTEGGLRAPFLVRGPGIMGNVCSRVPVAGFDILPTVARTRRLDRAINQRRSDGPQHYPR